MTTMSDIQALEAEVAAAKAAVQAFDSSTLVHEDGSTDEAAVAKLAALDARLDAATKRLEAAKAELAA